MLIPWQYLASEEYMRLIVPDSLPWRRNSGFSYLIAADDKVQ